MKKLILISLVFILLFSFTVKASSVIVHTPGEDSLSIINGNKGSGFKIGEIKKDGIPIKNPYVIVYDGNGNKHIFNQPTITQDDIQRVRNILYKLNPNLEQWQYGDNQITKIIKSEWPEPVVFSLGVDSQGFNPLSASFQHVKYCMSWNDPTWTGSGFSCDLIDPSNGQQWSSSWIESDPSPNFYRIYQLNGIFSCTKTFSGCTGSNSWKNGQCCRIDRNHDNIDKRYINNMQNQNNYEFFISQMNFWGYQDDCGSCNYDVLYPSDWYWNGYSSGTVTSDSATGADKYDIIDNIDGNSLYGQQETYNIQEPTNADLSGVTNKISRSNEFPIDNQETSMSCVPANLKNTLNYFKDNDSSLSEWNLIQGGYFCSGYTGTHEWCQGGTSIGDTITGFNHYLDFYNLTYMGVQSDASIQQQIDKGLPVYLKINWVGGGSHSATIVGYDNSGGLHWYINDPWNQLQRYSDTWFDSHQGAVAYFNATGCGKTVTQNTVLTTDLVNCPGDGLVIGASDITLDCNSHIIEGDNSGQHAGITVYGSNVTVKNCAVKEFYSGINLYYVNNISIINNNLYSNGFSIDSYQSNYNSIINNIISGSSYDGIYLDSSNYNFIAGNDISYSSIDGIYLTSSAYNTIVNNNLSLNNGNGINLRYSSFSNKISDNSLYNNSADGVAIYQSNYNSVYKNKAFYNYFGVYVHTSSHNIFYENDVNFNNQGFEIYSSYNTSFYDNNVLKNGGFGGLIQSTSLTYIYRNNISLNNGKGVWIYSGSGNLVWNNTFISNVYNAYEESGVTGNFWNNTNFGNYWSDFSSNIGYPYNYIIPGPGDGIDYWPFGKLPVVTILSPQNTTYYTTSVSLTFTVDVPTSWCGYSLDGRSNVTLTNCANTVLTGLSYSSHNIIVYATDTSGNTVSSNKVYFTVIDITPPTITILSPQRTSYYTTSIPLTFTVSEPTSWCGYSLDGAPSITLPNCANTVLTGLSYSSHNIIVYATDTSGNTGYSRVYFDLYRPSHGGGGCSTGKGSGGCNPV